VILAVDLQGGIENAWSNVATFVPKLAAALLILLVGYLVAKTLASILNKVLERVGFDRVVERGGVRQVLARSKYDPSDILAKLVFWTIMLFVLQLAFGVFGSNPISDLLRGLIAYLPNVFVAILIVVIAAAARAVTDLLANLLSAMQGGSQLRDQARASAQISTPDYPPTYDDATVGTGSSATEEFSPGRSRRRGR